MSWSRFRYICRKALSECNENESIKACLERIESEPEGSLYGEPVKLSSLAGRLLNGVINIEDEDQARKAVLIYKNLRLDDVQVQMSRFRRVFAYLVVVIAVFYLVLGIYRTKIIPTFLESYEVFEASAPEFILSFLSYSANLSALLIMLLLLVLFVFIVINKLFKFERYIEDGLVFKYLLSAKIKQPYRNLIEIIQFPVELNSSGGVLGSHLGNVYSGKMDLLTEMQELINLEMAKLVAACNLQLKAIATVMGVVITVCVFFLLYSVYMPLFAAGEMV